MIRPLFLKEWRVIILRHPQQALALMNAIHLVGGVPFALPTIEIHPLSVTETELARWIVAVENADVLFVASQHAIRLAPSRLLTKIAYQKNLKIITMGRATSQALEEKGLSAFLTLPSGETSEDLLGHLLLQQEAIKGKTVLLLAGMGGRTLVHDTLCERAANVRWMKVYQQHKPALDLTDLCQTWQQFEKVCFIATSLNGLKNLVLSVNSRDIPWLYHQPLITISSRIAKSAKEWGFQHIFISKGAECDALMLGLQSMQEICDTTQ